MKVLRFLGRLAMYALVVLWAPAWLATWWLWPPAPRSGWQIPANEQSRGFLSDSKHLVTEELTGEGKQRTATGKVYVRDVDTGVAVASYFTEKRAHRGLHGDVLVESLRLKEKPIKYPPMDGAGDEDLFDLRVRDAWTGEVYFEQKRVHGWGQVSGQHGMMAYVRQIDSSDVPEAVWRDIKTGRIVKTFPGVALPIQFSADGRRFLAARWRPEAKLEYTLVLITVPQGDVVQSMQVHCQPAARFMPLLSDDGRRVLAQGDVLDIEAGVTVFDSSEVWNFLRVLSSDGRYVVVSEDQNEPALEWRSATTGRVEIRRAYGPARSVGQSSGWMGRFEGDDFHWVHTGHTYKPQWPFEHRLRWLTKWLPQRPKSTHFIIAERDTGEVILQGVGHRPQWASPDGRLMVMEDAEDDRERLWTIPLDPGLPWPYAAAAGLALPAVVLWRRRRVSIAQPACNAGVQ